LMVKKFVTSITFIPPLSLTAMPTIYIFDYDADITYIFCNWFESYGYNVKGFSSPEQLLKQLSISHPDCIILDCLFDRTCITSKICNTIQQVYHYTGKLVLTSTSQLSEKYLQTCNTTHFIAKPFDLFEVLNLVNRLLFGSLKRSIMR
jgi:DNA-binding NtrC family response regulator